MLSKDYFRVPEEEIKGIESVLTVVNGDIVYAAGAFGPLAPPAIPVLPEWSPVVKVPGHYRSAPPQAARVGMSVLTTVAARAGFTTTSMTLPARQRCRYPTITLSGVRWVAAALHSDETK